MDNLKLLKNSNHDLVFIGNSRTKYNIDPNEVMNITGLTTYNSGMVSFHYFYWPTILPDILNSGKHKYIIMQIDINYLFSDGVVTLDQSQANLLGGGYNSIQSAILFHKAYFSKQVTFRDLLFNDYYTLLNYINFTYLETAIKNMIYNTNNTEGNNNDCKLAQLIGPKEVFNCADNSGFIQVKNNPALTLQEQKFENFESSELNTTTKYFLMQYIDMINNRGYEPIIVLLPIFGEHFKININYLQKALNVKIIDMTNINMTVEPNMWIDIVHMTKNGRTQYSRDLAFKINSIIGK